MKITVNGSERELKSGATLKDAIAGEPYVPGSSVSILLSTDRIRKESNNFEMVTERGSMTIHLDDSEDAKRWRSIIDSVKGSTSRWVTHNIIAFGSFPTDIKVNRTQRMYRRYDCFFSLGGFDNSTTYIMIARDDHRGGYGAGTGRIGRITRGRHIVDSLREGDHIIDIHPVISEHSTENVISTSDMKYKLEDGMAIETYVKLELNPNSPMTSEHVLVTTRHGQITISDATGSYSACSDNTDITLEEEVRAVRDVGSVTVRNQGAGVGRVFFYRERRQTVPAHNDAGTITLGRHIVGMANANDKVTVETVPKRVLSVGMTQAEGKKFLEAAGIKQVRTGDTSDDAIIVEQEPEWTINVLKAGEVETLGVQKDRIFRISLDRKKAPGDCHYFEKITGLSHKPIGTMKVHFTFKGMPLITFEGDENRGKSLYPLDPFKKCKRGDLGLTNQARPHHGLVGIRLEDSKEFGPTGEEPYGTNIFGKFDDDIERFMKGIKEGDVVYITEEKL